MNPTTAPLRRLLRLLLLVTTFAPLGALAQVGTPLGWGDFANHSTPRSATNLVAVSGSTLGILGLRVDGTVVTWPGTPEPPPGLSNVVEVSAGEILLAARLANGSVVAWGGGGHAQALELVRTPASLTNAALVTAGWDHGVAWTTSGDFVAWGLDTLGALGVPPRTPGVRSMDAGQQFTVFLDGNGFPRGWGSNQGDCLTFPAAFTNGVQVACSQLNHVVGLRGDGRVFAWGSNSHGQTTIGIPLNNAVQVAAGLFHSVALRADGSVHVWGGQGTAAAQPAPAGVKFLSVAAGGFFSVGLTRAPVSVSRHGTPWVPAGTPVDLEREFIGSDAWSVQWYRNGEAIPGATNNTLHLPNPQSGDNGAYIATASNEFGSTTSAVLDVTVARTVPRFHVPPAHVGVPRGATARFVAHARGAEPILYQWFHRGRALEGQTNATLEIPNAGEANEGPYHVVATNEGGSDTSIVALLSTGPVLFSSDPFNAAVLPGRPVRLTAVPVSPEPTTFVWWHGSRRVEGADTPKLDLGPATPAIAGEYRLVASNSFGAFTSRMAHVHVRVPPPPLTQPHLAVHADRNSLPYPPSFDAVIDARMARSRGFGTFAFAVTIDGRLVRWADSPDLEARLAPPPDLGPVALVQPGLFHALVRERAGSLRGWVWNEGENYGQSRPPEAAGDAVEFASSQYVSMALKPDGTLLQWPMQGFALPPGLRRAAAISTHHDSAMVLHEDGSTLRWDPDISWHGLVGPSVDAVAIWAGPELGVILRSTGRISLLAGIGLLDTPPLPGNARAVDIGGTDSLILALDESGRVWSRPVHGGNSAWSEWIPGLFGVSRLCPGINGTYALTRAPFFVRTPEPASVMQGASTSLVAEVRSPSPLRLQWMRSGQPIPGATQPVLEIRNADRPDSGEYSLVAINDAYSTTSAPVRVQVLAPPLVLGPDRVLVSAGDELALRPEIDSIGPVTFGWQRDGIPLPDAWELSLVLKNVQADAAGRYTLLVTNAYGASRGGPFVVSVLPAPPRWTRVPAGSQVLEGGRIELRAAARGTEPMSWQWFQDGVPIPDATGPTLVRHSATPSHAGQYTVRATNTVGSIESTPVAITISPSAPVAPGVSAWRIGRAMSPFEWAPVIAGSAPLALQWKRNGIDIPDATNATLRFTSLTDANGGSYTIHLSNHLGKASSAPMNLVVHPGTPPGTAVAWSLNGPSAALGVVQDLALGSGFAIALRPDGTVALWSATPNLPLRPPADLDRVVGIAAGDTFALALRDDGSVRAWGTTFTNPSVLQIPSNLGPAIGIAAGAAHAAALMPDGSVRIWGSIFGGNTNPPPSASSLVSITARGPFLGGIRSDGRGVTWRSSSPLSLPGAAVNLKSLALGPGFAIASRSNGVLVGWSTGPGSPPQTATTITNLTQVAAGNTHGLGLRTDGTVFAWGGNARGQTNVPPGLSNVVAVYAYGDLSAAITRAPGIIPAPASLVSEEGTELEIRAGVVSTDPVHLQWLLDGFVIPDATNAVLRLPALDGSLTLRASNRWQTVLSPATSLRSVGPIEWVWQEPAPGQRAILLRAPRARNARILESTNLLDWVSSGTLELPAEGILWTPAVFPEAPRVFLRAVVE